ncbi:MAG: hypothetical protein IJ619_03120 [Eubacterium sp.]|nr:hypothetical protein [Eubacterium sp.]
MIKLRKKLLILSILLVILSTGCRSISHNTDSNTETETGTVTESITTEESYATTTEFTTQTNTTSTTENKDTETTERSTNIDDTNKDSSMNTSSDFVLALMQFPMLFWKSGTTLPIISSVTGLMDMKNR